MYIYLAINAIVLIGFAATILGMWYYFNRKLEGEVSRAQKSERLKTVFLANVSHALRTPLNAIIGFSDIMLNGKPGDFSEEQKREMVGQINTNGHQLLYFVSELLELSAYETGMLTFTMIEVNLAELMASYRREALPETKPGVGIGIKTRLSPHCKAALDTNLMHQLVMHLLKNAARHTDKGRITLEYNRERSGMRVIVSDTGPGLPEKYKDNLFSMLHNEDALTLAGEASGLGLSICKSIVDSLHGEIDITSEPGKGTVASVWFPCRMRDMRKERL